MVALQHLLDPAVEAFDHAVGLRVLRQRQSVLDAKVTAKQVELVLAGGAALARAEQAVGENSLPLSFNTVRMLIGHALSESREASGGHS